jgi:endonuclease/exonuclease/phosphatase family metal-dependent hydrolase
MSKSLFRIFTKKILLFINIAIGVCFIMGCYASWFNPNRFWYFGLLSLAAPYFLLALFCFFVFWFFIKKRLMFFSIGFIALAFKPTLAIIKPNFKTVTDNKSPSAVRVMSWNVEHFGILNHKTNPEQKQQMLDLINDYKPDIACFQEAVASDYDSAAINYLPNIAEKLGFKFYHYSYSNTDDFDAKHRFGKLIFSQFPIAKTQTIILENKNYNNAYQVIDIIKDTDTIQIFNVHLQSLKFSNANLKYIEDAKDAQEIDLSKSKNIISKLKVGFLKRAKQSNAIQKTITESKYPIILCGDFNDVPNSYAYNTIGKNLLNTFEEKGSWISRTYSGISPTLRIDNIFVSKNFEVLNFKKINTNLSDHFPIFADIQLQAK